MKIKFGHALVTLREGMSRERITHLVKIIKWVETRLNTPFGIPSVSLNVDRGVAFYQDTKLMHLTGPTPSTLRFGSVYHHKCAA